MPYTPARIFGPTLLTPSLVSPIKTFTVKTIIKNLFLSNNFSGDILYSLYLDTTGAGAQEYNKIMPASAVPSKSFQSLDMTFVVNPGDVIYAVATVPGGLLLTISGVEIS